MGWNEFWDYFWSDTDESYYEHLENTYGKDAPVIHAILDTAVDTAIGSVPVVGQIYSVQNAKNPTIKEVKDVIWEDRHEILAVGSAVPAVGTVVSAVDATLHAAESVENNVEFFIEGAVADDEPIYDEQGNVVGYTNKWETDHMKEKGKHASSHGANATLGAVLTVTGGNYFKGGKAVVQSSKNGGNLIERFFIKNADDAAKAAEDAKRLSGEVAARGEREVGAAATNAAEKRGVADAADRTAKDAAETAAQKRAAAQNAEGTAQRAAENAAQRRAEADAAAAAAQGQTKGAMKKKASQAAQNANNAEGHAAATQARAEAKAAEAGAAEGVSAKAAENAAARKAEADAADAAVDAAKEKALQNNQAATYILNEAKRREQMGIKAIDFLQNSNNLRSFLTTTVSIGMATVSEHDKNVERFGLPDSDKWIKD